MYTCKYIINMLITRKIIKPSKISISINRYPDGDKFIDMSENYMELWTLNIKISGWNVYKKSKDVMISILIIKHIKIFIIGIKCNLFLKKY